MTNLTIINRLGVEQILDADDGMSLMEALRGQGFDELLALCGGCCSCATCHVYIELPQGETIAAITADENDLLESSDHRRDTSRLACEVKVSPKLAGAKIVIAPED